jgi:hypothetical protein
MGQQRDAPEDGVPEDVEDPEEPEEPEDPATESLESLGRRLGLRIGQWRTQLEWGQRELARRAGVSPTYIGQLETGGITRPMARTVDALARAFGWADGAALLRVLDTSDDAHPGTPPVRAQTRPPAAPAGRAPLQRSLRGRPATSATSATTGENETTPLDSGVTGGGWSTATTRSALRGRVVAGHHRLLLRTLYYDVRYVANTGRPVVAGGGTGGTADGGPEQAGEQVGVPDEAVAALDLAQPERLFAVEVADDSMTGDPNGDDLRAGDVALVDPSTVPEDGDLVCALVPARDGAAGELECVVKRYYRATGDVIVLAPNVVVPGASGRLEFRASEVQIEGVLLLIVHPVGRRKRTGTG